MLTDRDSKFWAPIPQIGEWLARIVPPGARVLDVGPGHSPLARADVSVDWVDVPGIKNLIRCDLAHDPLPFPDKSFDVVYCRHVLEDMHNPFLLVREMSRVGKAGYIEAPSPLAELGRGVDGGSPQYRGYHHHRFFVWDRAGELSFVSKYPIVEHTNFGDGAIDLALRSGPKYWNTYFAWSGEIRWKHWQNPLDYKFFPEYQTILGVAINESRAATDKFWREVETRMAA